MKFKSIILCAIFALFLFPAAAGFCAPEETRQFQKEEVSSDVCKYVAEEHKAARQIFPLFHGVQNFYISSLGSETFEVARESPTENVDRSDLQKIAACTISKKISHEDGIFLLPRFNAYWTPDIQKEDSLTILIKSRVIAGGTDYNGIFSQKITQVQVMYYRPGIDRLEQAAWTCSLSFPAQKNREKMLQLMSMTLHKCVGSNVQ